MDDDFGIRILEETMLQLRGLASERAMSVSDIVQEALGEYLYTRATGVNFFDVIQSMENAMRGAGQFVTNADPSGLALFIKSPLRHVHRPELKYEVRITRGGRAAVGTLGVILRSQDMETLRGFAEFSGLWMALERRYLARAGQIVYRTDAGYFGRQIYRPEEGGRGGGQLLGEAISNYIHVFDALLKHYFRHWSGGQEMEPLYLAQLKAGKLTI